MLKYMSQQVSSPVAKAAAAAIAGMVLRLIYVSYPQIYMKVVIDIGMIFFLLDISASLDSHSQQRRIPKSHRPRTNTE